jgi:hypothetical protein
MAQPPKKLPSIGTRAKNALGAAGRVGKAVATGEDVFVSNAERDKRIAICESNKCGAYNKKSKACNWCGCFINQKAKFATEECGEAELARRYGRAGRDHWTGETVAPAEIPIKRNPADKTAVIKTAKEEKPPEEEKPVIWKPRQPQVAGTRMTTYVTGRQLLDNETELRMILPPKGETVKKFNDYHEANNKPGGCTSCRRNSFIRAIEIAISNDFNNEGTDLVEKVRNVFPDSKYISAPSPTTWDTLLAR